MKCWICGQVGNTGEHLIKASDIRNHFRKISTDKPIYLHTEKRRNIPVRSAKSNLLKSEALICANCNNVRTQPHDKAWEKLSSYIQNNWINIKNSKRINLTKVFPGKVHKQLLNVHLYFVKSFGCRVAETKAPIDLSSFSASILNESPHDDIFLVFGETPGHSIVKYAGLTPIHSLDDKNKSIGAACIYTIGPISIKIFYSPIVKNGRALSNAWRPSNISKLLRLGKM